jgi:hypothetical protein
MIWLEYLCVTWPGVSANHSADQSLALPGSSEFQGCVADLSTSIFYKIFLQKYQISTVLLIFFNLINQPLKIFTILYEQPIVHSDCKIHDQIETDNFLKIIIYSVYQLCIK